MKKLIYLPLFLLIAAACDDEISADLEEIDPIVSIDAWINNSSRNIRVQRTQPYFQSTSLQGVTNAQVELQDDLGESFAFSHTGNGNYLMTIPQGVTFGEVGRTYFLTVTVDGVVFSSQSTLNRVPTVDSVTFRFEEEDSFLPDSYFGEFWARDFDGEGDTYWIRAWKNGQYLNKPSEINIAYDAAFSAGGSADGLIFIQPIRDGVNPFEEAEDDADRPFLSPYNVGDSLYVEIESISQEAHFFLTQVIDETDRPGGFGELFATPLSNVSTNLVASDPNVEVVGFFNVGAVSSGGNTLDSDDEARRDE